MEMKRTQILTNKPTYLGLSISDISKIVMHKFWYDYVKLKYRERTKSCYKEKTLTETLQKMLMKDVQTIKKLLD